MKYLIVNADDFGITKGVSDGIVEASVHGIVSSTTMFANSEYFDYAISLLNKNPGLGVGVHLNLTYGAPVSDCVPSLVEKKGHFHKEAALHDRVKAIKQDEIEREFTAQIEKIIGAGIKITHLDTHQHIQKIDKIGKVVSDLALKYGVGIRRVAEPLSGVRTTEKFTSSFHNDMVSEMNFKLLLRKFDKMESLEIMCHPGYFDLELLNKSRYSRKREIELSVLTKYDLKMYVKNMGIKLINYGELPG